MGKKRTKKEKPDLPPIGSRVRMSFGTGEVVATVIEHRGPLGGGGVELIRVRFMFGGGDDPLEAEVPVDDVSLVGSAA